MAESIPAQNERVPNRIQCYIPCSEDDQTSTFRYNPDLNAGDSYTSEYQGPNYASGGVQIGDKYSVFMGVKPSKEAAEVFSRNGPDSLSLKWAENVEKNLKDKLLGCDASSWKKGTRSVKGKEESVFVSAFNVPQRNLPDQFRGDLRNWEFGPTSEPLFVDFSAGINGEFGMITVGNNKHGAIPDINRDNWNDNVQVVWDDEIGKYVCQLDTYMAYKKVGWMKNAWTIKNTGGLITTHMYASGSYEVRAKVPQAPGLVWAIWTFWGNEIYSYQRERGERNTRSLRDVVPISDSPMWVGHESEYGHLFSQPGKQFPNHEIDIEIPSNAPQTINPTLKNSDKNNTINMNCYRWTNEDGTGCYNNLFCHNKKGPFIGDGKYHTYRFDWHTGNKDTPPVVDFYFDGEYVGSNDAFVPYMAGRLWIMFVAPPNGQPGGNGEWNGVIDQNFTARPSKVGEEAVYARAFIDYVRITPFMEENDHYAPSAFDQPCMGSQPGCVDCGRHNPNCGTTSIIPYTTSRESGCGGIKWIKK